MSRLHELKQHFHREPMLSTAHAYIVYLERWMSRLTDAVGDVDMSLEELAQLLAKMADEFDPLEEGP